MPAQDYPGKMFQRRWPASPPKAWGSAFGPRFDSLEPSSHLSSRAHQEKCHKGEELAPNLSWVHLLLSEHDFCSHSWPGAALPILGGNRRLPSCSKFPFREANDSTLSYHGVKVLKPPSLSNRSVWWCLLQRRML